MHYNKKQSDSLKKLSHTIRILASEAIEKAKSGHPGMVLGFADVMTCLIFNFLKFNPHDAKWFNRDRLILSAGHGSMLLYSVFYLTGYKGFSIDDIKSFRQLHSKAAGHPEYEAFDAIETTTGPLGQGLANAVGMAIAQKKYESKLGKKISNHKIYTIVGDGCLMEGVSYESAALAGHLQLNNLIVLFDSNGISIDGNTNLATSENQLKRFESVGFETISIDGHDFTQINNALSQAQNSTRPVFIECKTVIGKYTQYKENTAKAHGSPLGVDEILYLKNQHPEYVNEQNNSCIHDAFYVPDIIRSEWSNAWKRNEKEYNEWNAGLITLSTSHQNYINHQCSNISDAIDVSSIDHLYNIILPKSESTRVSSGKIIEALITHNDKIIIGSADLAGSNGLNNPHIAPIVAEDFSGNFIHYGVREHAMSAIMNGLSLSGFMPIGGTFFVFADYMRPAIRLSALMKLKIIYIMTHDSIGIGEDGPTHQPVEHLASFRAMPNINVFRPADFIETLECYKIILNDTQIPALLVLSRQNIAQSRVRLDDNDALHNLSSYGGYIISEANNAQDIDVTIFATGSEVIVAKEVQNILQKYHKSIRVCSVPSMELLYQQHPQYLVDLQGKAKVLCAIEAASNFGWHQIIGSDGIFFGMDSFGASAPAKILYDQFELTSDKIANKLLLNLNSS